MNPSYQQSVRPPRPARDWSWERGANLWNSRDPLELPPISWGSPRLVRGLVQDRLHQQNQTWVNRAEDSDSSFYSISDLESSIEIEPAGNLLDRLERGIVPVHVPGDLGSREPRTRPTASPGAAARQGSTPRQPRTARRSDWWLPPQVPLYGSLYERPRYTTVWSSTPVSGATGLSVITRVPPAEGDPAAGRVGDGTRGASSLPGLGVPGQEDAGQLLVTRESTIPRSRGPGCLHSISHTGCPPTSRTRITCQPIPQTVWEDEDLVVTRPSGEPLVFRLKQAVWQ